MKQETMTKNSSGGYNVGVYNVSGYEVFVCTKGSSGIQALQEFYIVTPPLALTSENY